MELIQVWRTLLSGHRNSAEHARRRDAHPGRPVVHVRREAPDQRAVPALHRAPEPLPREPVVLDHRAPPVPVL